MTNIFECQNYDKAELQYNKYYAPYDDNNEDTCYNCSEIIKDIDLHHECPHCEEIL